MIVAEVTCDDEFLQLETCTPDGTCERIFPLTFFGRDDVPPRYVLLAEPGAFGLRLSTFNNDTTATLTLRTVAMQDDDVVADNGARDGIDLRLETDERGVGVAAHAGTIEFGFSRRFVGSAQRAGTWSSVAVDGFIGFCDPAFRLFPRLCVDGDNAVLDSVPHATGPAVVAASFSAETYVTVFFFDPAPSGVVCPNGHDGGDGHCVANTACNAGFHDDGAGDCVPMGSCVHSFELDDDGRCAGFVPAGSIDRFTLNDDHVFAGLDLVVVGERDDGELTFATYSSATNQVGVVAHTTPSPSTGTRACPLADGRVLTVEYTGFVASSRTSVDRVFDPATGAVAVLNPAAGLAWDRPDCVELSDGTTLVYEAGQAARFDPDASTWTSAGPGLAGQVNNPRGVVVDDEFFTAGDRSSEFTRFSGTATWTTRRAAPGGSLSLDNARSFLDGRTIGVITTAATLLHYDVDGDTWTTDATPVPHRLHSIAQSDTGDLFGISTDDRVFTYELTSGAWTELPQPAYFRGLSEGVATFVDGSPHLWMEGAMRFVRGR